MAVFDRVAAKQAGYSDQEINDYLSQIQASKPAAPNPTQYLTAPAPVVAPPVTATPSASPAPVVAQKKSQPVPSKAEAEVRKSLLQGNLSSDNLFSGNDLVSNIVNSIAKPFVKTGKTIAGLGFEGARALDVATLPNPAKKMTPKEQAEFDKKIARTQQKDPFINEADFSGGNTKGLTDQAKNSIAIASWAVPFGKGANIFSKAVLPGAAVGAAQSLPDAQTPEDVARGAIIGGGTAGVIHGATKAVGAVSKVGGKVESLGDKARGGVSKIRVKPSVYGASKEAQISNTLDDLGITGTAEQKYAQLQPKMGELSDSIYAELSNKPKVIPIDSIRKDFLANLQDQMMSKSINSKVAQKEVNGYIQDLYNAGIKEGKIPDNISTPDLFKLKQMVNRQYQGVAKKLESQTPLNDREQVIYVARKTLDDIISTAHPEIKRLTVQQSNLYDAADSLARQRDVTPTLRVAGTTVPTGAVQKVQDTAGRVIQNTGRAIQVPGQLPYMPNTPVGQVTTRLASEVGNQPANGQENQTNTENANVGQDQFHTLPIIPQNADTQPPTPTYVTGYSPETLYQAYLKAQAAGDKTNAASLRQMYTDEAAYQKANKGAAAKPLSSQQVKDVALAQTGLRNIQTIKQELNLNDTAKTYDKTKAIESKIPGSPMARKLDAAAYEVVDAILRLRTGAQANPKEIKMYADQIIRPGDSYDAIAYKLQNYITYLESIAGQQSDVPDYASPTPTDNTYAQ